MQWCFPGAARAFALTPSRRVCRVRWPSFFMPSWLCASSILSHAAGTSARTPCEWTKHCETRRVMARYSVAGLQDLHSPVA